MEAKADGGKKVRRLFTQEQKFEILKESYNPKVSRHGVMPTGTSKIMPAPFLVQAALNFTPITDGVRQMLQQKLSPSRSEWETFLRTHKDTMTA
jgi:hypothetical protein